MPPVSRYERGVHGLASIALMGAYDQTEGYAFVRYVPKTGGPLIKISAAGDLWRSVHMGERDAAVSVLTT